MSYKQGLVALNSPLSFGKYKGIQVAEIYSGNPSKIVSSYQELLKISFEHMFSKGYFVTSSGSIDMSVTGERVDVQKVYDFGIALKKGATCDIELEFGRVRFSVYKRGVLDKELSMNACLLAQAFMRGDLRTHEVEQIGKLRPGFMFTKKLDDVESMLDRVEGDPNYIHWCIDKVEGFCLKGNEEMIAGLDEMPVFSFDSFKVGKVKSDFSFTFNLLLECRYNKAGKRTIAENLRKLQAFRNTPYYPEEVCNDDLSDARDNDDDEDNIMRALESGNRDSFGF